jgi:hypothetical protein
MPRVPFRPPAADMEFDAPPTYVQYVLLHYSMYGQESIRLYLAPTCLHGFLGLRALTARDREDAQYQNAEGSIGA